MITRTNFVLAVPDLAASATYFRDVLGFEVRDMGDVGWRMLVRDACCILMGHCPDAAPPASLGDHAYFGYFVVEDADTLHAEFTDKGATILHPPRTEPWGMREFAVQTPDGHRMMFGQSVEA